MLEAAQAHLDFAARTRKEAGESAARDARALAEKRALDDAEREAREARLVADLEAKIRELRSPSGKSPAWPRCRNRPTAKL